MAKKGKNQHVVRRDDGWAVLGEGNSRDTVRTSNQREAIERAREIAIRQGSEVVIHGRDGKIRERHHYQEVQSAWKIEPLVEAPPNLVVTSRDVSHNPNDEFHLLERIVVSRNVVHGKPRIAGTRIMVYQILDLLSTGKTVEELISDDYYPDIVAEDVYACIEYASRVIQSDDIVPIQ